MSRDDSWILNDLKIIDRTSKDTAGLLSIEFPDGFVFKGEYEGPLTPKLLVQWAKSVRSQWDERQESKNSETRSSESVYEDGSGRDPASAEQSGRGSSGTKESVQSGEEALYKALERKKLETKAKVDSLRDSIERSMANVKFTSAVLKLAEQEYLLLEKAEQDARKICEAHSADN